MSEELKHCPSCLFNKAEFEKFAKRMSGCVAWERHCPVVSKSQITQSWIVECLNCGMIVMFFCNDKNSTIEHWNNLPRKDTL